VGLALILLGGTMNTVDIIKAIPIPELADKLGIHLEFRGNGNPQMAICPFHDDHNPSFAYYPDTNTFRCFSIGCNKSGKAYQFIKDYAEKNNLKLSEVIKQMTEKIKVTGSVNLVTLKTLNPPFFKSKMKLWTI
jgi:DNA primase